MPPPATESGALLTVGHSSHSLQRFLELLRTHGVQGVADVRSWPASRHAPWFDREPLNEALTAAGVQYLFLGRELGGRPDDERFYDRDGHVLYDAVAGSRSFQDGLLKVRRGLAAIRVAVMCAEENPEHCHRRLLVARVLYEDGVGIVHIRGDGHLQRESGFRYEGSLLDEPVPWRSTASVLRRRRPRASSAA